MEDYEEIYFSVDGFCRIEFRNLFGGSQNLSRRKLIYHGQKRADLRRTGFRIQRDRVRIISEKAGVIVKSFNEMNNSELTADKIETLTSAVL